MFMKLNVASHQVVEAPKGSDPVCRTPSRNARMLTDVTKRLVAHGDTRTGSALEVLQVIAHGWIEFSEAEMPGLVVRRVRIVAEKEVRFIVGGQRRSVAEPQMMKYDRSKD